MKSDSSPETSARHLVYFAAERTLMSWIRTALGLMALGFVIDRFGLILRRVLPEFGTHALPRAASFWGGTALVVTGALMAFVAAARYLRFSVNFHRNESTRPRHGIVVAVIFAVVVALIAMGMAVFLIMVTDR